MSELVRPSTGGSVARPLAGVAQGRAKEKPGASAAGTNFDGTYTFDWETLPAAITGAVVDAAGEVAACELDERDQTVRRRRDTGEYWQPATIWRATRAGITLLKVRRGLRMIGPKRFAPTGAQDLDHAEFYPAAAAPSRRHGVVAESPLVAAAGPVQPAAGTTPEHGDYLPAPVRAELKALVPGPSYEHSSFLQWRSGTTGLPYQHTLRLLRMDAHRAVVVVAARETSTLPTGCTAAQAQRIVAQLSWDVTRYSYVLSAPQEAAAAREVQKPAPRPQLR